MIAARTLVSARAEALLSGARVCLVHAPPGLGAAAVAEAWAASQPGPIARHDCSADEAATVTARVKAVTTTERLGTLIVTGGHRVTDAELSRLDPPACWGIVVVDEVSTVRDPIDGVVLLHGRDLLVTDSEIRTYVAQWADPPDAAELAHSTHGWPGLVQIALEAHDSHRGPGAAALAIDSTVRSDLLPWMVTAWPEIAEHLMIAGTVTAAEIADVAPHDRPIWAAVLTNLGILVRVTDHGQDALRLLPAARVAGLKDLRAERPGEVRHVLSRIAATRSELGVLDCGLEAAHDLNDWGLCVRMLERWWLHLTFKGDLKLLGRVIHSVPGEARRASPTVGHLAELFGTVPLGSVPVHLPTDPGEIEALAMSDDVRAFVGRVLLAFMARRIRGQYVSSHSMARAASLVVSRTSLGAADDARGVIPGSSVADLKTFFYLHAGLSAQLAGDPATARFMFNQGWRERGWDGTGFAARATAMRLALEAAFAGESAEARRWLARAEEQPRTSAFAEQFASSGIDLAHYLIALDSTDPDEMDRRRVIIADGPERTEHWPFISWGLARHALMRWEPERALAMLESLKAHYPRMASSEGLQAALIPMLRAEAELALGRGNRALAELAGVPPTVSFGRITEARVCLLAGNHDDARVLAAETATGQDVARRTRVEALLIQSAAELRLGLLPNATASVRRAAGLMRDDPPLAALLGVPHATLKELAARIPDAAPLAQLRDTLVSSDIYPESIELVRLTDRESVVLHHLADGMTREDLARTLFVSENTVKTQLRTLYAKLEVSSRAAAVVRARELGFLSTPVAE